MELPTQCRYGENRKPKSRCGSHETRPAAVVFPMTTMTTTAPAATLAARVDALPWDALHGELDDHGFAVTPPLLTATECDDLAAQFGSGRVRATVAMARRRLGGGGDRYSDHPPPPPT